MGIEEMFGKTDEILIFDFLSQNMDSSYSIEEISEWLEMPKENVKEKIIHLIFNGLVIQENGKFKIYLNPITKHLINGIFANSYCIALYENKDEIELEKIRKEVENYGTRTN